MIAQGKASPRATPRVDRPQLFQALKGRQKTYASFSGFVPRMTDSTSAATAWPNCAAAARSRAISARAGERLLIEVDAPPTELSPRRSENFWRCLTFDNLEADGSVAIVVNSSLDFLNTLGCGRDLRLRRDSGFSRSRLKET